MHELIALEEQEAARETGAAPAGIEALYLSEYRRIRLLAWRFGIPEDELDDAVQDVFARACAGIERFRGHCALTTWLVRIAANHFANRRRGLFRRRARFRSPTEALEEAPAPAGAGAETREAYAEAVACIRRLPPKLRQVFVLRYLEEMNCAETAGILGIREPTVRSRAHNACKKLRTMMKGHRR